MEHAQDPNYRFHPGSYVVLRGSGPFDGVNYASECMGILRALHAVPVNVPLLIVADALSAQQAIWKTTSTDGKTLRSGARPIVIPARELMSIRNTFGTPTSREHVRSHIGIDSTFTAGNAKADEEALAAAQHHTTCEPMLLFDADCTMWETTSHGPQHISGDLRARLTRIATKEQTLLWCAKRTQGCLLRSNRDGTLAQLLNVYRAKDHKLTTFFIKAATQQLSTADKMLWGTAREAPDALACRLCRAPLNATHPFTCLGNTHRIRAACTKVEQHFASFCQWVRGSGAADKAHCLDLASLGHRQSLFTPGLPPPPLICTERDFATLLGILPRGLEMLPRKSRIGKEIDLKNFDATLPLRTTKFQIQTLREALVTYSSWLHLCNKADSDAAQDHVDGAGHPTAGEARINLLRLRRTARPKERPKSKGTPRQIVLNHGVIVDGRYICPCGGNVKGVPSSIRVHMRGKRHIAFVKGETTTPADTNARAPNRRHPRPHKDATVKHKRAATAHLQNRPSPALAPNTLDDGRGTPARKRKREADKTRPMRATNAAPPDKHHLYPYGGDVNNDSNSTHKHRQRTRHLTSTKDQISTHNDTNESNSNQRTIRVSQAALARASPTGGSSDQANTNWKPAH